MGTVTRLPFGPPRPSATQDILSLFGRLDPQEQRAITQAAEIVLVARRIMKREEPPKE